MSDRTRASRTGSPCSVALRWMGLALLAGLVGACGNSADVGGPSDSLPAGGTVIGAAGGKVTNGDGSVTLDIPAGALAADTTITAGAPVNPPPSLGVLAAVDFQPDGLVFSAPCTLTLSYDPAALPAGYGPGNAAVAIALGGTWIQIPAILDPVAMTLTAQIMHFSTFAVLVPSPTSYLPPIHPVGHRHATHFVTLGATAGVGEPESYIKYHSWAPPVETVLATINAPPGTVFHDAQVVADRLYVVAWSQSDPFLPPIVILRIYDVSVPSTPMLLTTVTIIQTADVAAQDGVPVQPDWVEDCCTLRPSLFVTADALGNPAMAYIAVGHTATLGGLYLVDVNDDMPLGAPVSNTLPAPPTDLYVSDDLVYVLSANRVDMFRPDDAMICCDIVGVGGVALDGVGSHMAVADFDGDAVHLIDASGLPMTLPFVSQSLPVGQPNGVAFGDHPDTPTPPHALVVTSATTGFHLFNAALGFELPPRGPSIGTSKPWAIHARGSDLVMGTFNAEGGGLVGFSLP